MTDFALDPLPILRNAHTQLADVGALEWQLAAADVTAATTARPEVFERTMGAGLKDAVVQYQENAGAVPQIMSVIPLRVEFHWQTVAVALPSPVTGMPPLGLLAPELRDGAGDLLVTDARSRLPGEQAHRSNDLNHAEVLWDRGVQQQVVTILRSAATTDQDAAGAPASGDQRAFLRLYERAETGRP